MGSADRADDSPRRRGDRQVAGVGDPDTQTRRRPRDDDQPSHEAHLQLLDAVTAIGEDLELAEVLRRIVRSACLLVHARYGALGVLGPDGRHLSQFVTHGMDDDQRDRIGAPPEGHGVLGLLIRDPRPQRLVDITAHPDAHGFPASHPTMRSFLGAPIRIHDHVFGNLYLAEREGRADFTEADEVLIVALAGAAGFAIENARLYEHSQSRRLWTQSSRSLAQRLLEGQHEGAALGRAAEEVCAITGARRCFVALRDDGPTLRLRALHGPGLSRSVAIGVPLPDPGPDETAEVLDRPGHPVTVDPATVRPAAPQLRGTLQRVTGVRLDGPVHVSRIATGTCTLGHLAVEWAPGRELPAASVQADLEVYAQQVGLAIVASRAQHDRQIVAMLEERDRIARDMHDHVIQRLFATGLSLQSAARLSTHPVVVSRIDAAVTSLDEAIGLIRAAIFDLHALHPGRTLREQLDGLVASAAAALGFVPRLTVEGDDERLDAGLQADVLAVVGEGLANVSRHAHASHAAVVVRLGDTVTAEVVDDGVGLDGGARRSGLSNLERRALERSGSLRLEPVQPHGTRLVWSAQVPPASTA